MHAESQGYSPKQFPLSFLLHSTWKEIDGKKCFLSDSQERHSCQHFLLSRMFSKEENREQLPQCRPAREDKGQQGSGGCSCSQSQQALWQEQPCQGNRKNLVLLGDNIQLHSSTLHLIPEINSQVVLNRSLYWGFFFPISSQCLFDVLQIIHISLPLASPPLSPSFSLSHTYTHTHPSILKTFSLSHTRTHTHTHTSILKRLHLCLVSFKISTRGTGGHNTDHFLTMVLWFSLWWGIAPVTAPSQNPF